MDKGILRRIANWFGLTLLGGCFVLSLGRVFFDHDGVHEGGGGNVTIRVAHWQLEGGVREAIDRIAAEYMKLHPNVRILQLPVPEKIYPNWLITQLVGGTAPDIIQVGLGMTDERLARYFMPSTGMGNSPNPYNQGTELENVPLRETIFDGMESAYRPNLLEYYGVPLSGFSIRMFYNLELLKEITGSDQIPQTYEDLIKVAEATRAYAKRTGRRVFPIAGSKYNAPMIMGRLLKSQTEDLAERVAFDFPGTRSSIERIAEGYAKGSWSLRSPEVTAGLDLMRDLGQHMQPGFMQLLRDDASFYFVQGKAVMIATGSWDITSIRQQVDFPVGVGPIPVPSPEGDPRWPYSKGPLGDISADAGVLMAITRESENPEVALDFLYFLTSKKMSQLWTDVSGWVPVVVGVEARDDARAFLPDIDSYPGGFLLDFSGVDSARAYGINVNRLVSSSGSREEFLERLEPEYDEALVSDLERNAVVTRDQNLRNDTLLGVLAYQASQGNEEASAKLDLLLQASAMSNRNYHRQKEAEAAFKSRR